MKIILNRGEWDRAGYHQKNRRRKRKNNVQLVIILYNYGEWINLWTQILNGFYKSINVISESLYFIFNHHIFPAFSKVDTNLPTTKTARLPRRGGECDGRDDGDIPVPIRVLGIPPPPWLPMGFVKNGYHFVVCIDQVKYFKYQVSNLTWFFLT